MNVRMREKEKWNCPKSFSFYRFYAPYWDPVCRVVDVQKMADADSIILLVDGTFRGGDHRKWSRVCGQTRTFLHFSALCPRSFAQYILYERDTGKNAQYMEQRAMVVNRTSE